jgi:hypothetical protein
LLWLVKVDIEADRDYHLSLPTRRRSQFSLGPLSYFRNKVRKK